MPAWFTAACLTTLSSVLAVRLVAVRTTPMDRMTNLSIVLVILAAFLREPAIARHVASVTPGGLPVLFDVWHWLLLQSLTGAVGMLLMHRLGPHRYKLPVHALMGSAGILGIAFFVLSVPAHVRGVSIPDYGGWRYCAYSVLYSAYAAAVLLYALKLLVSIRVRARTAWPLTVVTAANLFVYADVATTSLISVDALSRACRISNRFTEITRHLSSGELTTPFLVVTVLLALPSGAVVTQILRVDADSRAVRQLQPIWRYLTAAAPEVVLPLSWTDRRNGTPAERLHRCRVEVLDAAEIVSRYTDPLPDELDTVVERNVDEDDQEDARSVLELMCAAQRLATLGADRRLAGQPSPTRQPIPDLDTLLRLWEQATSLLLRAGNLPQGSHQCY